MTGGELWWRRLGQETIGGGGLWWWLELGVRGGGGLSWW